MTSNRFRILTVLMGSIATTAWSATPQQGPSRSALTFEQRVAAQTRIERVYWEDRIWPADNPGERPAFEEAMPDAAIRARVDEYLKKSEALADLRGRPLAGWELQAEMNRMAAESKSPDRLRLLFDALGNDPILVAECLARPILAARLLGSADERPESWWRSKSVPADFDAAPPEGGYQLPAIAASCSDDTWKATFTDVPAPRRYHTAVWTGTEMIVWGGLSTAGGELNSGGRYDPATDTWTPTSRAGAPQARYGHVAVWTGARMIVWGGLQTYNSVPLATGGRYDPSTDSWQSTSTGANVSPAREAFSGVWTGTEMIVCGGRTSGGIATGSRYNPVSDTWASTSPMPGGRYDHSAVWTGSEMILWGGVRSDSNAGYRYFPASNTWVTIDASVTADDRRSHSAVWTGTEMIVWGSSSGANTGGRYRPATNTWLPTSTGAGTPLGGSGHSAVWTGSAMIIWGGGSGGTNTGARYDPVSDTWTPTPTGAGVPVAHSSHTAVWTGSEMIIWGGSVGSASSVESQRAGRYHPASNTWTSASLGSGPRPRSGHRAVWTGTEMIVVGDPVGGGGFTGDRYDPATDSWSPTTMVNAPLGRTAFTAVWTGTHVIVWGGIATNQENSGGKYNPALNTWTPTSTTGAPDGRSYHTAIWTGTRMVIWGGRWCGSDTCGLNTGGRYDPATDSWTSTSLGGAPGARSTHTAVWTGSRMIVWGGKLATGLNAATGGLYDPDADSWTATATTGAPNARQYHAAVWTGSEMLVWGNSSFPQGGRYNPTTNSWQPMATAGQPAARDNPAAVWTGVEMIVWGGNNTVYENTGGRYNPTMNAWTQPTSLSAAPNAGFSFTAVWTGSEMIVWGGGPDSVSGARYCACATPQSAYRDTDGDAFGDAANPVVVCSGIIPPGASANSNDCDDTRPDTYPGAAQLCDGRNNNCSDPSWPVVPANEANADGDAFRVCAGDCDDARSDTYPGAPQLCDGRNNNCSDPSWPSGPANEADADADTYRICAGDCNDANAAVHPGATEICNNVDDDCDALIDEDAQGQDSDGDGVRNLCDNCRFAVNPTQLDSDADHVGNACDNCVGVANTNQADGDGDQVGTVCDNCPIDANPSQADADGDRAGDACDNCFLDYNPTQSDSNADGEGDVCDLNDGLIWEFREDKLSVSWQAETGPTSWNVYIGDLSVLRSAGLYTQAPGSNSLADRHCGEIFTFVDELGLPGPGEVSFSLVTGVQGGIEGSLGNDGNGVTRPNANPCP